MRHLLAAAFLAAFASAAAAAQVDQKRIDAAIKKGIEWLKTAPSPPHEHSKAEHSDELILWTFIHAEVAPSNPRYKALLERILADEPHQTYKVALQAMCLEEIDRVKYQSRIAHCGQHLLDNQCTNGQWSYGSPTPAPKDLPAPVASGGGDPKPTGGVREFGGEKKAKPKIVKKIALKRQRDGGGGGDNSNSQYAALGLRACFDAGIMFPEDVIHLSVKWWMESVNAPEGKDPNAVASGAGGVPQGWDYSKGQEGGSYGSMTAGAVGSLVIYDYMLKKDWKRNPLVKNGMAWLNANYSVTENPKRGGGWHYYYLYGLERAAILFDTNLIGNHDWYLDGCKYLLDGQKPDGSWQGGTWDTCFAILFLKKATRPLVATEGGGKK